MQGTCDSMIISSIKDGSCQNNCLMSSALRARTGKLAQLKSTKFTETKRQQEAIERVNLSILGKKRNL